MKLCKLLVKMSFFVYFALNAFNALQDPHKKAEEFSKEYTAFEKSIRERCTCKWPEALTASNLTKHSLQIVKYGYYVQLAAAVGVLVHSWFAVLVGLSFLMFQTVHLNIGTFGLGSKFTEWEMVAKMVTLVVTCLAFSCCDKCEKGRSECIRKTGHKQESEHQADKKKTDVQTNKDKKSSK